MTEEIKNVNKKIDEAEAAVKKYASKDTVISIGGYEFTPAKLMVAFTLVSSLLGGLYGAFEVYKDYVGMKKKIAEYVAPDFSAYEARIIKLEENSDKVVGYTRDVNQNLKGDIRRTESVLENVERTTKSAQRDVEKEVAAIRREMAQEIKEIRRGAEAQVREMQKQVDSTVQNVNERVNRIERETTAEVRTIRREVDDKIKKAMDNPLAK